MLGLPPDRANWQQSFGTLVRDAGSAELRQPAGYMFKDLPEVDEGSFASVLVAEMDRWGIETGLLPVTFAEDDLGGQLRRDHPDRFEGSWVLDPNTGPAGVAELRRAVHELGVRAAACFPAGANPQVPIDDARMYPFYAACVDLGIPIFVNAG